MACPFDCDRQFDCDRLGAGIHITFAAQAFGDDERLCHCRRLARPATPQGLRAEFAKRLMIEPCKFHGRQKVRCQAL